LILVTISMLGGNDLAHDSESGDGVRVPAVDP